MVLCQFSSSQLECELFGHVSYDDSVSVWVLPTQSLPDNLMVCVGVGVGVSSELCSFVY